MILATSVPFEFKPGETIYEKQKEIQYIYIIVKGAIQDVLNTNNFIEQSNDANLDYNKSESVD